MRFEHLKQRVRALPEVSAWPLMAGLMDRTLHQDFRSVWEYPVAACLAVGGSEEDAAPGAAAIFCSLLAIHLVDDMLDEDPRGEHHRQGVGVGQAANLALAFQAAAHRVLDEAPTSGPVRCALQASLSRMTLATAFGQNLDLHQPLDEREYWRIVDAKTPPLFGAAFEIGALLGGASAALAHEVARLGRVLGHFVQISDDLADALAFPAQADWQRPGNNLALLYARTATYPEREEFLEVAARVHDPAALEAAHRILVRSGAVSYCVLWLVELSRQAGDLLAGLALHDRAPLEHLLALKRRSLVQLFGRAGVEAEALALV